MGSSPKHVSEYHHSFQVYFADKGRLVSAKDADITFQSVDDVQFRIHKRNLKASTEGFCPPEHSTFEDVAHLTEHSSVLELLFQFIYPIPQPDLDSMDFKIIEALAEAAEKYQVYPAMSRCNHYMK
jgi:hypothetical protein